MKYGEYTTKLLTQFGQRGGLKVKKGNKFYIYCEFFFPTYSYIQILLFAKQGFGILPTSSPLLYIRYTDIYVNIIIFLDVGCLFVNLSVHQRIRGEFSHYFRDFKCLNYIEIDLILDEEEFYRHIPKH